MSGPQVPARPSPVVRVEPLNAARFADLARLFQARGCAEARGCWCMFYRHSGSRPVPMGQRLAEVRQREMQALAGQTPAPGLIAYRGDEPVGWVSLGPREDFAKLRRSRAMKPVDERPVWSIVCFVVPQAQRGQGLARLLLDAAVQFAGQHGAQLLEAYPVDKPAPVESGPVWFGFEPMFRAAGFEEVARRLPTRPVMRLQLQQPGAMPATAATAAKKTPATR